MILRLKIIVSYLVNNYKAILPTIESHLSLDDIALLSDAAESTASSVPVNNTPNVPYDDSNDGFIIIVTPSQGGSPPDSFTQSLLLFCRKLTFQNDLLNNKIIVFLTKLFKGQYTISIIDYMSGVCEPLSGLVYHLPWILPISYIIYEYRKFIYKVYHYDLQFRVPSQKYIVSLCNLQELTLRVITRDGTNPAILLEETTLLARMSKFYKNQILSFVRFRYIKDLMGLVKANKLNLTWENVHNTYMGKGLKSLFCKKYSSILVQLTTRVYSKVHKKHLTGFFHILVIVGFGVVVWSHFTEHPHIPPDSYIFNDPTAVVEGYRRITYWMTKDIDQLVLRAFKQELPFSEILYKNDYLVSLMSQYKIEGGRFMLKSEMELAVDLSRMVNIGTAIMIASFISTNILN